MMFAITILSLSLYTISSIATTLPSQYLCPKGAIVFGNSLSDTGNAAALFPVPSDTPPYGVTFPGYPTGRFSDGKLIIDYIGDAFKFTIDHYLVDIKPDYSTGINFAQAGATARSTIFLNPFYLSLQVQQFFRFKQRLVSGVNLRRDSCDLHSLPPSSFATTFQYMMEIGGNDVIFNLHPFFGNKSLDEVRDVVIPQAVEAIKSVIQQLRDQGGRNFMMFGITPLGCLPLIKTVFFTRDPAAYDSNGCLIAYNNISLIFNTRLKEAIDSLRVRNSDTTFFYADLYNSYFEIINNAATYGFRDLVNACCGTGAPYNYSPLRVCGTPNVPFCSDPSSYISWDGIHYTQRYSQVVANFLLTGRFLDPPLNFRSLCRLKN